MKSKALLAVFALSQLTCHQALFVADPDSTMTCFPNPEEIPADRGVSVVSCLVIDGTGNPVPDGVTVQFFTTLGRIPEQGKTNDGVVRVNFESTGRSGIAQVTATSGGPATGGGGGSTTTTTSLSAERSAGGLSASDNRTTAALTGIAAASFTFPIQIGNVNVAQIFVNVTPSRINETRPGEVTANVLDGAGNPVPGVAVFFMVNSGTTTTGTGTPVPGGAAATESLDSQGQPVFTDTNGQAHDVLRTRWPREAASRTVTVSARAAAGPASNNFPVTIN
jgi:hypothetical protein